MADDDRLTERRCNHCGHPTLDMARFCAECGAPLVAPGAASTLTSTVTMRPEKSANAPSIPPGMVPGGAKTVMGFGAMALPLTGPAAAKPSVPPSPAPAPAALTRTMLGMAQSPLEPAAPKAAAGTPAGPTKPGPPLRQTMLGIAMPGIAPLDPTEPPPTLPRPVPVPTQRYPQFTPPSDPPRAGPVVPAPAPLIDVPAPASARFGRAKGVPIVTVALIAGGLVLAGGGAIAWFWRSASAVTAEPHSSPTGGDVLHLHCDPRSCRDGTTAEVNGTKVAFAGGESDLPLSEPLHIGDNTLAIRIDRPGWGRDEVLRLVVPLAFRVTADLEAMSAVPPSIVMRVEAAPGSDVTMDGKPLTLDGSGRGAYAVDESAVTEGPADESHVVSLDVPYVVIPAGGTKPAAPEKGTVSARVVVAPLHVDTPGPHAVIDADHVLVAGRAAKGARVTLDGAPVTVGTEGVFEGDVALPAIGERTVEVRTETASLRPRTVRLSVKRVESLADEANAFEKREKIIGYDAAMHDLPGSVGQPFVVEGEIIDSRKFGYGAVLLVDDRRGCAKGPCLARVLLDHDLNLARGAVIRAYGHVTRPFTTPEGHGVPEIDADFVVAARK